MNKKTLGITAALLLFAGGLAAGYFWTSSKTETPESPEAVEATAAAAEVTEPEAAEPEVAVERPSVS